MARKPPKPNPSRVTPGLPEVIDHTEPRPGERVVVATLSSGDVALAFHESFMTTAESYLRSPLAYRLDERGWRIVARSGSNISRARNRIVKQFLEMEHQPEWLLMVDSDMAWDAKAIEQLLFSADPDKILGGLCFAYSTGGRVIPTIFQESETMAFAPPEPGYELPAKPTLIQCAGTGGAFLLVHRDALWKIQALNPGTPNAWFREIEVAIPNPKHDPADPTSPELVPHWISEDLWFCAQAYEAGLAVFVHTGVHVDHIKEHRLTRELYETAPTLAKLA